MPLTQSLNSIERLAVDDESWWSHESAPIRAALVEHYGRELAGSALTEPPDPAALRSLLRQAAPRLTALCARIRAAFDDGGAAAVLIPAFGLAGVEVDQARKAVFAFAALLGDPSANDPFDHVVWDVMDRGEEGSGHMSFSESANRARYHTDNGAFAVPERFFLLYAVRAAECGGGKSKLRDIRVILRQLEQTEEGRSVIRVLTETKLPKRIPEALRERAYVAEDGYQYSPVFAEIPRVRWRTAGLRKGLVDRPEYDTPEIRNALDTVRELLNSGEPELGEVVPTDGMLVVNNHIALHGRCAFTDPARHLFRLRFHEPSA